ncbi:unnamed protein product [marine sediment metagenome]|uniref:Uncharacterized protein n=1 Tax=marine sediment metagenome TaxID=412755 RepID=X1A6I1_9ZZZZ
MTLGFLKLPYLSPIINVINTEQVAAFQFLIDHEQTFNHTSTGTLNETSEYPMDYIRTELYSSFINATDFTAESKNYLKQTQVISENFTYRREWLEISNITFDLSTGILKKQETSIMNSFSIF